MAMDEIGPGARQTRNDLRPKRAKLPLRSCREFHLFLFADAKLMRPACRDRAIETFGGRRHCRRLRRLCTEPCGSAAD